MIFDRIENLGKYESVIPHYKSIKEILKKDLLNHKEGCYKVEEGLSYIVSKYETLKEKPFEVHHEKIDLQIVISGEEKMELGKPTLEIQSYDSEGDCALSEGHSTSTIYSTNENFALFYPFEYHKPGISINEDILIKKIIFKIKK
jgi:YhcH/YjgK/YiaL family protein